MEKESPSLSIHSHLHVLPATWPFWKYCKWHICVTWLWFNASLLFINTSLIKAFITNRWRSLAKQGRCRLLQSLDPWFLICDWAFITDNFTTQFIATKGAFPCPQAVFKLSWNNELYYINTDEKTGELLRENICSNVKITIFSRVKRSPLHVR